MIKTFWSAEKFSSYISQQPLINYLSQQILQWYTRRNVCEETPWILDNRVMYKRVVNVGLRVHSFFRQWNAAHRTWLFSTITVVYQLISRRAKEAPRVKVPWPSVRRGPDSVPDVYIVLWNHHHAIRLLSFPPVISRADKCVHWRQHWSRRRFVCFVCK